MKISLKIFVFTYCIMMFVTVVGGFTLVNYLYRTDFDNAMEAAVENNELLYTYIATLDEIPDNNYAEYSLASFIQRLPGSNGDNCVFVGNHEEWQKRVILDGYPELQTGQVVSSVIDTDNGKCIQITSRYMKRYIINYYNISGILEQRDSNYRFYKYVIIIVSIVIAIVLYIFSWYTTRPLSKVMTAAERISGGDYTARVDASYKNMKSHEVMKLGETLNHLAEHTEEHIYELEELAQKREDFVGNFTHEIKTPLTSIIGYADLLRTYDLKPDKRREYSSFIYNEGKRLEQLSFNLLQLIVMGRTDFSMVTVDTMLLFEKLKDAVRFSAEKYSVRIRLKSEHAYVMAEPSLILAAVINLIDNACKASEKGQSISVIGKNLDESYAIYVIDNGRGIPEDELDKIMEPFYMVDKSRARSQGGAGLGLALCHKIAEIHGGDIKIKSVLGKGTSVMLTIDMMNGDDEYE